jgi:hypothetical protein
VVDLDSGHGGRRLHDHPSTKGLKAPDLRIVIEGEQLLYRPEDATSSPVAAGARRYRPPAELRELLERYLRLQIAAWSESVDEGVEPVGRLEVARVVALALAELVA